MLHWHDWAWHRPDLFKIYFHYQHACTCTICSNKLAFGCVRWKAPEKVTLADLPFLGFIPSKRLQLLCICLASGSYHAYGQFLNRFDQWSASIKGVISLPSHQYTWTIDWTPYGLQHCVSLDGRWLPRQWFQYYHWQVPVLNNLGKDQLNRCMVRDS